MQDDQFLSDWSDGDEIDLERDTSGHSRQRLEEGADPSKPDVVALELGQARIEEMSNGVLRKHVASCGYVAAVPPHRCVSQRECVRHREAC